MPLIRAPYDRLAYIVKKCLGTGKAVQIYSDILGVIAEKMNVEFYSSIPVMTFFQNPLDSRDWSVKYNIDNIISGLAPDYFFPYYFGVLTIAGDTEDLKVILKVPNLVMRRRGGSLCGTCAENAPA